MVSVIFLSLPSTTCSSFKSGMECGTEEEMGSRERIPFAMNGPNFSHSGECTLGRCFNGQLVPIYISASFQDGMKRLGRMGPGEAILCSTSERDPNASCPPKVSLHSDRKRSQGALFFAEGGQEER